MLIHSSRVFDPWRGGHALACESAYRDARFCEHPMESYALRSSPGTRVARSWWSNGAKFHNQPPQITLLPLTLLLQAPQATHSWALWCSTNYDALPQITMLLKRKFGSCENLTFCKKYGIIYIENERRREDEKPRLPPTHKFFQKNFLRLRYLSGLFLSWVYVHLPGSHVGMAHVLLSLSPYIIPPCGRATCLGEFMMVPPRGAHWDSYVGHMTMRKPSWREAALTNPRFYENFFQKNFWGSRRSLKSIRA